MTKYRLRSLLFALFTLAAASFPARAGVVIAFYSHALSTYGDRIAYPHAYITLEGEAGDRPVKANFGFTPPEVGLGIFFGWTQGEIVSAQDDYIAQDKPHFVFPLSDRQYADVLAVVDKWRNWPQPSYDLDKHNCVIFVRDIAQVLGMKVRSDNKFVRDPESFLEDLKMRNADYLARANAPAPVSAPGPELASAP